MTCHHVASVQHSRTSVGAAKSAYWLRHPRVLDWLQRRFDRPRDGIAVEYSNGTRFSLQPEIIPDSSGELQTG